MRKEKTAAILYTDSPFGIFPVKKLLIIVVVKAIPFVMTLIPLPFYIYCIIIVFYIAETISLQYKNESTLNALFTFFPFIYTAF